MRVARSRYLTLLLVGMLALVGIAPVRADTQAGQPMQFAATGHTLAYNFRLHYEGRGGLPVFGYPITEVFLENGIPVQYFERARLEWHAPLATVTAGHLGRWLALGREAEAPFVPLAAPPDPTFEGLYFPETGHTLETYFLRYWRHFGALENFGYPISQPFYEVLTPDEPPYLVQYFERARFELHPELPLDHRVQLSHVGRMYLAAYPPPAHVLVPPSTATEAWQAVRPQWISIPRIGLETQIEMGGFSYGTWDVPRHTAVAYWPVSAVPGTAGNLVLAGHVGYAGIIFNQLPQAQVGDLIYVGTSDAVHTYQITELHTLLPHETWPMQPTASETLTLITCVPINVYTHRLIVRAVPVS